MVNARPTHTLIVRFFDPDGQAQRWQVTYGAGCWTADSCGSPQFDYLLGGCEPDRDETEAIIELMADAEQAEAIAYRLNGADWVDLTREMVSL